MGSLSTSKGRVVWLALVGVTAAWVLLAILGSNRDLSWEWYSTAASAVSAGLVVLNLVLVRRYGLGGRLGRAVVLLSLGSLAWAIGQALWFRLATCGDWPVLACDASRAVPYPALSDFAYLALYPLSLAGMLLMSRLVGVTRRDVLRGSLVLVPAVLLLAALALPPTTIGPLEFGWDAARDGGGGQVGMLVTMLYLLGDVAIILVSCILAIAAYRWRSTALSQAASLIACGHWFLYLGDTLFFGWLATDQQDASIVSSLCYAVGGILVPAGVLGLLTARRDFAVPEPGHARVTDRLATAILHAHRAFLGPSAATVAAQVRGISQNGDELAISGSPDAMRAVRELIDAYATIGGDFSLRLSRAAAEALAVREPDMGAPAERLVEELDRRIARPDGTYDPSGKQLRDPIAAHAIMLGAVGLHAATTGVADWWGGEAAALVLATVLAVNLAALVVCVGRGAALRPLSVILGVFTVTLGGLAMIAGSPDALPFVLFMPFSAVWFTMYAPAAHQHAHLAVFGGSMVAVLVASRAGDHPVDPVFPLVLFAGVLSMVLGLRRELVSVRGSADAVRTVNASLGSFVDELERTRSEERHRIAGELHDHALQGLIAAQLALHQAAEQEDPAAARAFVQQAGTLLTEATRSLRAIMGGIEPVSLFNEDLSSALAAAGDELSALFGIRFETDVSSDVDLPLGYQRTLYRVLREAMNNAAHHSGATKVEVELYVEGDVVVGCVSDDGCGFSEGHQGDPANGHAGMGLRLMAEQVRALNGTFDIDSTPGSGTKVSIRLPLPRASMGRVRVS